MYELIKTLVEGLGRELESELAKGNYAKAKKLLKGFPFLTEEQKENYWHWKVGEIETW